MGVSFQRGTTFTLRFTVSDPSAMASLGTPVVAISQENTALVFDSDRLTVDSANGTVSVDITEAESVRLVDGIPVTCQLAFSNEEAQTSYKFPMHQLVVLPSILGSLLPSDEPEPEPVPEPLPDDPEEDPIGGIIYDDPTEYWPDEDEDEPFYDPEPVEDLELVDAEDAEESTNIERTAEDDAAFEE